MTPEEMQKKSAEKVQQVENLMGILHLTVEAKQVLTKQGIIENKVFFIDKEEYPKLEEKKDETA